MKAYIVLIKLEGDKTSFYEALRQDVFWWRCCKASSRRVAITKALKAALSQLLYPPPMEAVLAECVTPKKAVAVAEAYKRGVGSASYHVNTAHLYDIWHTIRVNAPELLNK